jgi:molybdate transport system substrate-binding protein
MPSLHVLSTNAVERVLHDCIPEYERDAGVNVSVAFGATGDLRRKIESGARADVTVLAREALDALAQRGSIVADKRVALARSGIAVAVRAGQPKPAIDTPEAFKRSLAGARSVAHSKTGASGIYFVQLIKRLGMTQELKGRLIAVEGKSAGEAVAAGAAELGIQQLSELLAVPGIEIAGFLPGDLQKFTLFEAAVLSCATDKHAASALLHFLASAFPPLLQRHGLEPPILSARSCDERIG